MPVKFQRGAALVEFSITFLVYLLLVFAIIEFALVVFNSARLAEGTRVGARYAIVNNPACDIFNKGTGNACDGGHLTCPGGSIAITIESCDNTSTSSECRMVVEMDKLMLRYHADNGVYQQRSILAGDGTVNLTYSCSETGDPSNPFVVPIVTVSATNVQHNMMLFGTSITLPDFSTSRTGEDLFNR